MTTSRRFIYNSELWRSWTKKRNTNDVVVLYNIDSGRESSKWFLKRSLSSSSFCDFVTSDSQSKVWKIVLETPALKPKLGSGFDDDVLFNLFRLKNPLSNWMFLLSIVQIKYFISRLMLKTYYMMCKMSLVIIVLTDFEKGG